jgi:dTDP-3-amino-3,4,6-trideoxy-alpha-D-glucose transaminase
MGSQRQSVRTPTRVPFLDLAPAHDGLKAGLLAAISDLIDTGAFTNGPHVAAFEREWAAYCGTVECVGVASGLDALRLALLGLKLEPGDEVVVPALTFIATVEAVTQAGGRPVVADVSEADYCLDAAAAGAALTPRTRVLLPVHLYGQMADVVALRRLAASQTLALVEDACQAHGAERDGLRAGASGMAGAFSFYPGKNLGAMGDAGALVTNDSGLAARARALREHGQTKKYEHGVEGYTARLDTVQALVLLHKLRQLDEWNAQRQRAAAFYLDALADLGDLQLSPVAASSEHVWHVFVVRTGNPDALTAFLAERGIGTGRHYPHPVHLTRAYEWLGLPRGAFPVAEAVAAEAISLPLFPGITEEQLSAVVEAIRRYFGGG